MRLARCAWQTSLLLTVGLMPVGAWSQTRTSADKAELRVGQIVQDRFDDEGRAKSYRLVLAPGEAVQIDAQSAEGESTDPVLTLYRQGSDDIVASDDDGGGGTNARLFADSELGSEFRLEITNFMETSGSFELLVRKAEASNTALVEPLVIGGPSRTLILVAGNREATAGRAAGQMFKLEGSLRDAMERGQSLTIEMTSEDDNLDPVLEAGFNTPLGFAVAASDDDGGGGLDARLELNLQGFRDDPSQLDEIIIRARSFTGARGEYTITAQVGD